MVNHVVPTPPSMTLRLPTCLLGCPWYFLNGLQITPI